MEPTRNCSVEDCERPAVTRGYCSGHYTHVRKFGEPRQLRPYVRDSVCTVEGCDRRAAAKTLCQGHYGRYLKHGTPGVGPLVGSPRGPQRLCSLDGCDRPHRSNGYCSLHRQRLLAHGDPTVVLPAGGGNYLGDDVTYMGAHDRTRCANGPASNYPCAHCGKRARDWAYNHEDPNEKYGPHGGKWFIYSPDPAYYFPLCRKCHIAFDAPTKRRPEGQRKDAM